LLLDDRGARLVEEAEELVLDNAAWVLLEDTLETPDEVLDRLVEEVVCKFALDVAG